MMYRIVAIAAATLAVAASAQPAASARFSPGGHFAAPHANLTVRSTTFNRQPSWRRPHAISSTDSHRPGRITTSSSHSRYPKGHAVGTCDGPCPPRHPPGGTTECRNGKCPPVHPPGGTTECRRGKCPPVHPPGGTAQCDGKCPPIRPPHPHPLPPITTVTGVPIAPPIPTGTGIATPSGPPTVATGPSGGNFGNSPPTDPVRSLADPNLRHFNVPPDSERRYQPDEVLLDMGPTASPESVEAMTRRHRLTRLESFRVRLTGHTLHRLRIPDARTVPEVIRALSRDARIVAAEPNFLFTLQDDTRSLSATAQAETPAQEDSPQYVVTKLRLDEVHRIVTGRRVMVAMIDTGVDASHPYLAGSVTDAFNALGGEDGADEHGTAMAGAIVEHGELTGVAPGARLLSVRAFARSASKNATVDAIIKGLDWAVEHGARVVNMSFAGPRATFLEPSIATAYRRNVVLVAAAGNDGPRAAPAYPGALAEVIAVTATDSDDRVFDHANRGRYIAVAAPGVDVVAPILHAAVKPVTGTSIAAAHVSGLAALLIERNPSLRPEDIRRILTTTAVRPAPDAQPEAVGAGRVDAFAAVRSLGPGSASSGAAQAQAQ
jgi:subtilisin family serine protease